MHTRSSQVKYHYHWSENETGAPAKSCTQCISMFPPKLSMEAQLESNKCYLGNLVVALELQCTGMVGSWYDVDC